MAILTIKVILIIMSHIMIQDLQVECIDKGALISWNTLAEIDIWEYEVYFNDKLIKKIPAKNPGGIAFQSYKVEITTSNSKGVYQVIGGSSQETIAFPGCSFYERE